MLASTTRPCCPLPCRGVARAPCPASGLRAPHRLLVVVPRAQETEQPPAAPSPSSSSSLPVDDESITAKKKAEAERLRAAEKFMVVGAGTATCSSCGYEYKPEKGDPDFPIPKGMRFQDTPEDYFCPTCGAPKSKFLVQQKVVAGFAENQGYGLGTNSMTSEQKSLLIYGSLVAFFALFMAGYFLD